MFIHGTTLIHALQKETRTATWMELAHIKMSEQRRPEKFDSIYIKYQQAGLVDMARSLHSGYPRGEVIINWLWGAAYVLIFDLIDGFKGVSENSESCMCVRGALFSMYKRPSKIQKMDFSVGFKGFPNVVL